MRIAANVRASGYSSTGLTSGTTYYYRVTAVDTLGNQSSYSAPASATTLISALWCERPVPIGVSTGHPKVTAGTIACRVVDAQGNVYALSNNHIYANENRARFGDNVLQPGAYDGGANPRDALGTLRAFKPIVFSRFANNTIDAAIALSSPATLGDSTPGDGYGTPSSTYVTASVGQAVMKYGRTTKLTSGTVSAVNATVTVEYETGVLARFVGQIVIASDSGSFSGAGDSGSLIVTQEGKHPVGLLFAGSTSVTIANPIGAVLTYFGVQVDGTEE
jgi:hypothetical protein